MAGISESGGGPGKTKFYDGPLDGGNSREVGNNTGVEEGVGVTTDDDVHIRDLFSYFQIGLEPGVSDSDNDVNSSFLHLLCLARYIRYLIIYFHFPRLRQQLKNVEADHVTLLR